QQRQLQQQRLAREQRLLALAKQRAAASSLSDADVSRLELRLIRSQLALTALDNALELGRAQLAAHWGEAANFNRVEGSLESLPLLPALAELQRSLLQSPSLAQFVSQSRLHQAQLRLTQAGQSADINLTAGIRRTQSNND